MTGWLTGYQEAWVPLQPQVQGDMAGTPSRLRIGFLRQSPVLDMRQARGHEVPILWGRRLSSDKKCVTVGLSLGDGAYNEVRGQGGGVPGG